MERLTDLLIDGTLDKDDFEQRKRSLILDLAMMAEERSKATQSGPKPEDIQNFLELIRTLSLLYGSATDDEKRNLVENCFSNRTLSGKKLELKPSNWLSELKYSGGVPAGDPRRPTSRTLDFGEVIDGISTLHNIFHKPKDPEPVPIAPPGEQQWKYNLKKRGYC